MRAFFSAACEALPARYVTEPMDREKAVGKDTTVGIIGDGQLGMMLCEAGKALALGTVILTSDKNSPAAQRADQAIVGAMDAAGAIDTLIERCDVITYEREDVPPATLEQLREAEGLGRVRCYPPVSAIEVLQDKARQKTWLRDQGLATLPFAIVDGSAGQLQAAADQLGYPLVQKALRGGFDGRGVQLLRDSDALEKAWPGDTMLEKHAGKFREIAVLVVRDRNGNCAHFGPVDMTFEEDYAVLDTVSAPANIPAPVHEQALALAYAAAHALNGVGVFGVEMFLLEDDTVLINEIAPRVHNSGHYSMEACESSQFEQHLRAVAGLPLASTVLRQPAAMINILCTPALKQRNADYPAGQTRDAQGSAVHWYGKSPARLMRKLGHITATAASPAEALRISRASWDAIQQGTSQS